MGIKKDQAGTIVAADPVMQSQITSQINSEASGGFPPIAFFGDASVPTGTPQIAVVGCAYIHQCGCTNNCGCLQLPASPADGAEVGWYAMCGSGPIKIDTNGKQYRQYNNCNIQAASTCATPTPFGSPAVMRYSLARDIWENVQY